MGLFGRKVKARPQTNAGREGLRGAEDDANGPRPEDDLEASDVHICSLCGAPLGFDREDEIDGEGPGRDICGECNRARNFDMEAGR